VHAAPVRARHRLPRSGFGHVHIARNEGTTPVTVVQTYLNVPPGGSPRVEAPAPGNCPF